MRRDPLAKIGNREKALVHVAAKALGFDEDTYRMTLRRVGVGSAKDLTFGQLDELMKHYSKCGFKAAPKPKTRQKWRDKGVIPEKEASIKKIGAILLDMGLPWKYADSMARQMFGVEQALWLKPEELHKLAQALCVYQKRKAKKEKAQ